MPSSWTAPISNADILFLIVAILLHMVNFFVASWLYDIAMYGPGLTLLTAITPIPHTVPLLICATCGWRRQGVHSHVVKDKTYKPRQGGCTATSKSHLFFSAFSSLMHRFNLVLIMILARPERGDISRPTVHIPGYIFEIFYGGRALTSASYNRHFSTRVASSHPSPT